MRVPATSYDPAVKGILEALKLMDRSVTKLVITIEHHQLVQVQITEETYSEVLDKITESITNYELTPK